MGWAGALAATLEHLPEVAVYTPVMRLRRPSTSLSAAGRGSQGSQGCCPAVHPALRLLQLWYPGFSSPRDGRHAHCSSGSGHRERAIMLAGNSQAVDHGPQPGTPRHGEVPPTPSCWHSYFAETDPNHPRTDPSNCRVHSGDWGGLCR